MLWVARMADETSRGEKTTLTKLELLQELAESMPDLVDVDVAIDAA